MREQVQGRQRVLEQQQELVQRQEREQRQDEEERQDGEEAESVCMVVDRERLALNRPHGRCGNRRECRRRQPELVERIHQHALRSAQRADRPQTAFADAVVDRPARHTEQPRGLIDRNTPPERRGH